MTQLSYNSNKNQATGFVFILFTLTAVVHSTKDDEYKNGKLTSGQVYGGESKYHHILVEPKDPKSSRVSSSQSSTRLNSEDSSSNDFATSQYNWFTSSRGSGCYRLVRTRTRIARQFVQKEVRTNDRAGCEYQCAIAKNFACRGFNFRYKIHGQFQNRANCELSLQDTYGADLDDERTFHHDEDFDFYERTKFGRDCDGKPLPPNHLDEPPPSLTTTTSSPRGLTAWDLRNAWPQTPTDVVSPTSVLQQDLPSQHSPIGGGNNGQPSSSGGGGGGIGGVGGVSGGGGGTRNNNQHQQSVSSASTAVGSTGATFLSSIAQSQGTAILTSNSFTSSGRVDTRLNEVGHRNPRPFLSEPVKHAGTSSSLTDIEEGGTDSSGLPRSSITSVGTSATINANHHTATSTGTADDHLITSNTATISSNTAIITPETASTTFTTNSNTVITRQPISRSRNDNGGWSSASNIAPLNEIRFHRVSNAVNNNNNRNANRNSGSRFSNDRLAGRPNERTGVTSRGRPLNTRPDQATRPLGNRNVNDNRQPNQHFIITSNERHQGGRPQSNDQLFHPIRFPDERDQQNNPNFHSVVFHRVPDDRSNNNFGVPLNTGANEIIDTSNAGRLPAFGSRNATQGNKYYWITPDSNYDDRDVSDDERYMWITSSDLINTPMDTLSPNVADDNRFSAGFGGSQPLGESTASRFRSNVDQFGSDTSNTRTQEDRFRPHSGLSAGANDGRFNADNNIRPQNDRFRPLSSGGTRDQIEANNVINPQSNRFRPSSTGDRVNEDKIALDNNVRIQNDRFRPQTSAGTATDDKLALSNEIGSQNDRFRPVDRVNIGFGSRPSTERFRPSNNNFGTGSDRINTGSGRRPSIAINFGTSAASGISSDDTSGGGIGVTSGGGIGVTSGGGIGVFTPSDYYGPDHGYRQTSDDQTRSTAQAATGSFGGSGGTPINNLFNTNFNRVNQYDNTANEYGSGGVYGSIGNANTDSGFRRVRPSQTATGSNNENMGDANRDTDTRQTQNKFLPVDVNFPNIMYDFPGGRRRNRTNTALTTSNKFASTTVSSINVNQNAGGFFSRPRPGSQYIPPSSGTINSNVGSRDPYRPVSVPQSNSNNDRFDDNVNSNQLGSAGSRPVSRPRPGAGGFFGAFGASGVSGGIFGGSGGASGGSGGALGGSGGFGSGGTSGSHQGAMDTYREECFELARPNTRLEERLVREKITAFDLDECKLKCHQASRFSCKAFSFKYRGSARRGDNCFLSDRELAEVRTFDQPADPGYDLFQRRFYDRKCGGFSTATLQQQQEGGIETVSGLRCYGNSRCTEDHVAGYWYCETNSAGAWDYCCRPNQVCSDSDGHAFKWCYVGSHGLEQWRPCTGLSRDYLLESQDNSTRDNSSTTAGGDNSLYPKLTPNNPGSTASSSGKGDGVQAAFPLKGVQAEDDESINPTRSRFTASIFKESANKLYPADSGPKVSDSQASEDQQKPVLREKLGTPAETRAVPDIELLDLPNLG